MVVSGAVGTRLVPTDHRHHRSRAGWGQPPIPLMPTVARLYVGAFYIQQNYKETL